MLLVLTTGKGQGVNIFTYKPELGIFMLSHCNIRIPEMGEKSSYSVNQGNTQLWDDKTRAVFDHFMNQKMSSRHIDSLVADFHRTILTGGIFAYPANAKNPHGKLRLLCEEVPLAMIAEEAGGSASNGSVPTLDIQPISLHQRYPLYIGNTDAVKKAEEILKG